ncbi:formate/nitrite transporter family protein [Thermococcus nautili]|uniref:Probable formate transporter n=1 Tax=Thermococcus nautili TaxID=195522 RepID=W8NW30_9EURY|nr:formate/nitrite transporter family protein [Thermococcus nautili]AHL23498.1 Formate/nitrite family of transporters [Thermococcus nautili]
MSEILYGVDSTFEGIAKKATPKFKTTPGRLLFAGFMAGAYIAFGFVLAVIAATGFHDNPSAFKLLLGAVFPVGLIAVILAGADLWTGNVQFLSSAKAKGYADFRCVLYNWFGSYGGNFIGSVFIALLAVQLTGLFGHVGDPNAFGKTIVAIAHGKVSKDFIALLFLGIGCNWLVNVAIWQSARVQDGAGKILAIWFPIFAFVAIGFEHAIANMWAIPMGVFLSNGAINWASFFHNLIPVTLGNAIGGFLFVSFYYWYLSHPELTARRLAKEIVDFTVVFVAFWVLATLIPAGIALALKNNLYAFPLVLSVYYVAGTFALARIAKPGVRG